MTRKDWFRMFVDLFDQGAGFVPLGGCKSFRFELRRREKMNCLAKFNFRVGRGGEQADSDCLCCCCHSLLQGRLLQNL